MKLTYLKYSFMRAALSIGCAVFIAAFVNYYCSFSQEYWLILAAFFAGTTRAAPLRQAIYSFLFIVIAMLIFSFLLFLIKPSITSAQAMQILNNRMLDIMIGTIIGVLSGRLIFPVKLAQEFCRGLIPLLQALKNYLDVYADSLFANKNNFLAEKQEQIEKNLQGIYPEWAYETGFNPGLRAGFRFFLVKLDYIVEIFFAMNYLANGKIDASLLKEMRVSITNSLHKNADLIAILMHY